MTLAEYPEATWYPIPGFGFPQGTHGRSGFKSHWIIIHGTASGDGTALQQARFFAANGGHGVHFVIGKDGTVIQMVLLGDASYGNGIIQSPHDAWWTSAVNPNLTTVSIEHCKTHSDNSDPLTAAQQAASFRLVKWLCQKLNIPARKADGAGGITGHYSIEGIDRKYCPNTYPWEALWASLSAPASTATPTSTPTPIQPTGGPMVPAGWHDDEQNKVLTAPNGVVVVHGFRDTVLNPRSILGWDHDWRANDWPLAPEKTLASVEPGNASIGGGTRQDFRMTSLGWTQSRNVYQIWAGQDLLALQQQMATVAQHNADLQAKLTDTQNKLTALQATQGLGLSPAQAAVINQFMPYIVGIAAGAPSFTTAFANVPRPNVTAPLPAAPVTN